MTTPIKIITCLNDIVNKCICITDVYFWCNFPNECIHSLTSKLGWVPAQNLELWIMKLISMFQQGSSNPVSDSSWTIVFLYERKTLPNQDLNLRPLEIFLTRSTIWAFSPRKFENYNFISDIWITPLASFGHFWYFYNKLLYFLIAWN